MIVLLFYLFFFLQEVRTLKEEKKEYIVTIDELQGQIGKLRGKTLIDWTANDVLDWILTIDNGVFKPYESMLTTEILNNNVNGKDLMSLTVTRIQDLGVNKFAHQMLLLNKISDLVQKNKDSDKFLPLSDNENNEGGVTFI